MGNQSVARAGDDDVVRSEEEITYQLAREHFPVLMRGIVISMRQGVGLHWLCKKNHRDERDKLSDLGILRIEGELQDGHCDRVTVAEEYLQLICPNGEPPQSRVRIRRNQLPDLSPEVAGIQGMAG